MSEGFYDISGNYVLYNKNREQVKDKSIYSLVKQYKTKPSKNYFSVFGGYVSDKRAIDVSMSYKVFEGFDGTVVPDATDLKNTATTVLNSMPPYNPPQNNNVTIQSGNISPSLVNATYYSDDAKVYLDVTDKMKKYVNSDSIKFNGSYNNEFSDIAVGKTKKLDISYRCGDNMTPVIKTLNENDTIALSCPSVDQSSLNLVKGKLNISNVYSECPNMSKVDITDKFNKLSNGSNVRLSKNQFIGLLPSSYQSCNPKFNFTIQCNDNSPTPVTNFDIPVDHFTADCSKVSTLTKDQITKSKVGNLPLDKLNELTPSMIINNNLDTGDFTQKQLDNLSQEQKMAVKKLFFPQKPPSCNGGTFDKCVNNYTLNWCYNNCIDQKDGESINTPPLNGDDNEPSKYIMVVTYKSNEGTMNKRSLVVENILKLENGYQVYIAYDYDGTTRMISTTGICKWYSGPTSNFSPAYWKYYNIVPVNSYQIVLRNNDLNISLSEQSMPNTLKEASQQLSQQPSQQQSQQPSQQPSQQQSLLQSLQQLLSQSSQQTSSQQAQTSSQQAQTPSQQPLSIQQLLSQQPSSQNQSPQPSQLPQLDPTLLQSLSQLFSQKQQQPQQSDQQSNQQSDSDYLTTQRFRDPKSGVKGQTCSCIYKY